MKQWISKTYQIDTLKIAQRYQISEIVAEVLVKRGLFNWEDMDAYLFPDMNCLHDIRQMKDAVRAAQIIEAKIKEGKKIKIIGDYDVDGVMSAYILYQGIIMLGGKAGYRIPHRVHDGYGIREYMVTEAYQEGYDTIITCDNGISAVSAVKKAKEMGMTILVTDHHEVPVENGKEMLPPADAVVDAKQSACLYPFKQLCGAGVVYKLIAYLWERNGLSGCQKQFLPFAAVATVCDVVPLLGENRILVKQGLKYMEKCRNPGLLALIEALGFQRKLSSYDLGFRIGPCINAAGRLKDAALGMELLLETNPKDARKKADRLVQLNEQRKDYTAQATKKAVQIIEAEGMHKDKVFVIYIKEWHESVAGIVAGRIREKYYHPVLILTDGKNGLKGSGRSIPGYHIQRALVHCRDLLTEYGGHAMAAGFSVPPGNLGLLRKRLNENCSLTEQELTEKIYFDKETALADMTETVVRQLECMAPFGEGNEQAVFAVRNVKIVSLRLCGKEKQIARIQLKEGSRLYSGVDFQCEQHLGKAIRSRYGETVWDSIKRENETDCTVDILYQPSVNQKYGGVDFKIVDCR